MRFCGSWGWIRFRGTVNILELMANLETDYYVYVYIDPRNLEEFYYGKGTGNRKNAHLKDDGDSEKSLRIRAIKKEGLEPVIKVIAKDLTENEAFLIEKTLIWKLGKNLTNISSGHFADKFRPHDTLHIDLMGFDFKNGVYYVNVGEGEHRCWDDCVKYGFLAAGQDLKFNMPLRTLEVGDVVVAYLKRHGYVGVGKVSERAVDINAFRVDNKPLSLLELKAPNMFKNADNENCEYVVKIDWRRIFEPKGAKWKANSGLFTSQLVKASLQNQPLTLDFIEKEFSINFKDLLLEE